LYPRSVTEARPSIFSSFWRGYQAIPVFRVEENTRCVEIADRTLCQWHSARFLFTLSSEEFRLLDCFHSICGLTAHFKTGVLQEHYVKQRMPV